MKTHICRIACLVIFFLFFFSEHSFAQAPPIQWQKPLGGSASDAAYSIFQTSDGGYVVTGYTNSNDGDVTGHHDSADCWVVKLSSTGAIQWQKSLGGSRPDYGWSIRQTFDGGYIVAGSSKSTDGDVTGNHGGTDAWVVKLNSTGGMQWQKCLGGTGWDQANAVVQTADSDYVVCGYSNSNDGDVTGNHGGDDYWVVKLDGTGGIVWQKTFGGAADDDAYAMQLTSDGGFIISGTTSSNDGDVAGNFDVTQGNYWIVKLSSSGTLQWQKSMGSTGWDIANAVQQTTDGGYIVNGYAPANDSDVTGNHGGTDFWVVKLSSAGAVLWKKCFGGTNYDYGQSVCQDADGGFVLAGAANSNDGDVIKAHGIADMWIAKITATGGVDWQVCFGGAAEDWAQAVLATADGGYVVAGYTKSNDGDVDNMSHGNSDFWVVKLASKVAVGAVVPGADIAIYPNPANTVLTISAAERIGEISITDLPGQVIQTLRPGKEQVDIDVSVLPPGVYMVTINGSKVRRFVKE